MKKQVSSFSLSPENIEYIDDQWKVKGKRNRSHWLDDLITHLREKSESERPRKPVKRFAKPTVLEVQSYMIERGENPAEADRFCDFYEMKGWMVGKNKMKDWKAAVRNWLKGKGNEASQQKHATGGNASARVSEALEKQRAEFYGSSEIMGDNGGVLHGQVDKEKRNDPVIDLDDGDWTPVR